MKNKMLIIEPIGGLGNRMRVIASAVKVREMYGVEVRCIWNINAELNACFRDLFKRIDGVSIKEVPYTKILKKSGITTFLRRIYMGKADLYVLDIDFLDSTWMDKVNVSDIVNRQHLYIHTCEQFIDNLDYSMFVPKKHIVDKINAIYQDCGCDNVVGIHIRRSDNTISIKNSPVVEFYKRMNREIELDAKVKFFLSTDDVQVEQDILRLYGSRIIYNNNKILYRNERQGIVDAVIDMYCLSKTRIIYGSYWSSFSQISSNILHNKLEVVRI